MQCQNVFPQSLKRTNFYIKNLKILFAKQEVISQTQILLYNQKKKRIQMRPHTKRNEKMNDLDLIQTLIKTVYYFNFFFQFGLTKLCMNENASSFF